ncbi:MAG: hypothetical protein ACQKBW_03325, partial [Puniceicoccales bacterium]
GTFNVSDNRFALRGGNMVINGGSLTQTINTTAEAFRIEREESTLTIMSNVDFGIANIAQRNGSIAIDGASLTTGSLNFAINTTYGTGYPSLSLNNGASLTLTTAGGGTGTLTYGANDLTYYGQVSIGSGVNTLTAAATTNRFQNFNFDFATDSIGSSIAVSGSLDATGWENQWIAGHLTIAGSNSGTFGDYFSVSGNTLTLNAAPIPEPSAFYYLTGIAFLAVLIRRRKQS